MNAPLLVTGGTGNIGRRVVPLLRHAGRDIRILSRQPRTDVPGIEHFEGDTVAGHGLATALDGVDVVAIDDSFDNAGTAGLPLTTATLQEVSA